MKKIQLYIDIIDDLIAKCVAENHENKNTELIKLFNIYIKFYELIKKDSELNNNESIITKEDQKIIDDFLSKNKHDLPC